MKFKIFVILLVLSSIIFSQQKGGSMKGGRPPSEVKKTLNEEVPKLRYIYNKRLREIPDLEGVILGKIAVDEFGNVIWFEIIEKTLSDSILEVELEKKVKTWKFTKVHKPGDVTEIEFPFIFCLKPGNEKCKLKPAHNKKM